MEVSLPRVVARPAVLRRELLVDMAIVAAVTLASALLYVTRLGFYTDDWFFIGALFEQAPDRSYLGLLWHFTDSNTLPRPVQLVYLTTLYYLFGTNPVGYHIVNTLSMAATSALFYLLLRELRLGARLALATALVFALLPHASASRFWYALAQANLSALFCCLSLYADMRLVRAAPNRRPRWHLLGALGLLLSTLAYELLIPLLALAPALVWLQRRRLAAAGEEVAGPRLPLVVLARNWTLLVAVMAFKIFTTNRAEGGFDPLGQLAWFANLQLDAFRWMLVGPFGYRMPLMAWRTLHEYYDPGALALSLAVAAAVFAALLRRPARPEDGLPPLRTLLILAGLGLLLAAAGYGIFLTNRQALIALTGINNRSSLGALFGIALLIAAGAGVAARLLRRERAVATAFALLVALYTGGSTLAVATLGNMWAAASQEQHAIMAEVRQRFPTLAPGSSLIIDGYCPYVGPAPVFEAYWDTSGMLRELYGDPTLQGDTINHRTEIRPDGIYTRMYGLHEVRTPATEAAAAQGQLRRLELIPYFVHRYDRLWIYNRAHNLVVRIPDAAAARAYIERYNPRQDSGCGRFGAGFGARVW
jgi:hypothetical protein